MADSTLDIGHTDKNEFNIVSPITLDSGTTCKSVQVEQSWSHGAPVERIASHIGHPGATLSHYAPKSLASRARDHSSKDLCYTGLGKFLSFTIFCSPRL